LSTDRPCLKAVTLVLILRKRVSLAWSQLAFEPLWEFLHRAKIANESRLISVLVFPYVLDPTQKPT
jgi:hypothetical protein